MFFSAMNFHVWFCLPQFCDVNKVIISNLKKNLVEFDHKLYMLIKMYKHPSISN
jgi:hypothetical protein